MEKLATPEGFEYAHPAQFQVLFIDTESQAVDLRVSPIHEPAAEYARTVPLAEIIRTEQDLRVGDIGLYALLRAIGDENGGTEVFAMLLRPKSRGLFSPEALAFAAELRSRKVDHFPDDDL